MLASAAASPRGAVLPRGSSRTRDASVGGGRRVRVGGGRAPRAARRASRAGPTTPRAVSIFDAARGEDEPSRSIPGSMGTDAATPPAATPSRPNPPPNPTTPPARRRPAGAPVVAPTVISSKAALLATAEDLVDDDDAAEERLARRGARTARGGGEDQKGGVVGWTLEAVDRGLDSVERERPSTAQAAWKVASEAEKVANNPTVRKGVKLTADAGIEVVKRAAPVIGKVAGNVGKFAAKSAFSAAVGGVFPKKKNDGGKSKEK
jgi:hypothetical protein